MHSTYSQPPAGAAPEAETTAVPDTGDKQAAFGSQLAQVEELTNELKRLLVNCEATLEAEGIREQVETLERWAESYRRGIKAAGKISELGPAWLTDLRGRLKMAADEMGRQADEGGTPLTKDQAALSEQLLRASRKIDEVLPNLEQIVQPALDAEAGIKKAS